MSTSGLRDATVVVTGAGSGIGEAAALRFAAAGSRVVVADLDGGTAASTVEEITSAGASAVAVVGDLSEQRVIDEVVETARTRFGGVDVLVNNAGVMDDMSAPADLTDDEWDRLVRINLTAPFKLMRAVIPGMLEKGKGAVVNTASEASLRGSAAGTAYTATKHGVIGLTKSAAIMYREQGIRVNAVAPGATATNISVQADPEAPGPGVLASYRNSIGRVGEADDLAAAIQFLASDDAGNISGVVLPVDNGWSAV